MISCNSHDLPELSSQSFRQEDRTAVWVWWTSPSNEEAMVSALSTSSFKAQLFQWMFLLFRQSGFLRIFFFGGGWGASLVLPLSSILVFLRFHFDIFLCILCNFCCSENRLAFSKPSLVLEGSLCLFLSSSTKNSEGLLGSRGRSLQMSSEEWFWDGPFI